MEMMEFQTLVADPANHKDGEQFHSVQTKDRKEFINTIQKKREATGKVLWTEVKICKNQKLEHMLNARRGKQSCHQAMTKCFKEQYETRPHTLVTKKH